MLTENLITSAESERFLAAVQSLPELRAGDLHRLNVALPEGTLLVAKPGLF
jgi:2-methylcitrate dehydratase